MGLWDDCDNCLGGNEKMFDDCSECKERRSVCDVCGYCQECRMIQD